MKHYIDKDNIVEEINRRINEYNTPIDRLGSNNIRLNECKNILSFLDTLDVKEEILDKSGKTMLMQKCVREAYKRGYDMGALQTTNKMNHNTKEIDLEKHLKEDIENVLFDLNGVAVKGATSYLTVEDVKDIAKHFFELGLKTKEE